ncbi:MAG TPA: septum formation initiator family protein [Coriobacteriia bacterium]
MTPRNTQLGASAATRRAPVRRDGAASSSSRTPKKRKPSPSRAATTSRPKRGASWFRWWLLPIFVTAAIAVFAMSFYPVARVQYRETRERARLQAEYDALSARNTRLATQVARLKTPEGVEDYARSQLGMVKAGEHVVVVVDGTAKPSTLTTAGTPPELDSSGETTSAPSGPWTAFLDSVFNVQ